MGARRRDESRESRTQNSRSPEQPAAPGQAMLLRKSEGDGGRQLTPASSLASQLAARAGDYIRQAKAPATLRAYRSDWADFSGWCQAMGVCGLPATAQTVCLYLTDRAGPGAGGSTSARRSADEGAADPPSKVSTLQRRLSSISQAHEAAGHPSPTKTPAVRNLWQGLRRAKGVAQTAKTPAVTGLVRRMIDSPVCCAGLTHGKRNRALLLLGFAGAFRRSELVSLDREDVETTPDGLIVTLRRSKTDQEGEGRRIGIPYGKSPQTCPVRALESWIDAAGITRGALFRSVTRHGHIRPDRLTAQSVALIVKTAAEAAGLDPAGFAGHSLRAGLATSAAAAGAPERAIMEQTGHRSVAMVRRYVRHGSLFRENAAGMVGL